MNKVLRSWGYYITLLRTKKLCIKILRFNERSHISMQRHQNRSEFWLLLVGWGSMDLGGSGFMFAMDHCLVRPNQWHQFKSNTPCLVLEIQYGKHVSEDDIERKPI